MAGQLNSFVPKFYSLWKTGNDAHLSLECHAGKAQIHLQLNLPPQQRRQPPSPPQQPRRHLGPSQLCRRARRELTRASAAEATDPAAENADDDDALAPGTGMIEYDKIDFEMQLDNPWELQLKKSS
jgi:hypothetical protein